MLFQLNFIVVTSRFNFVVSFAANSKLSVELDEKLFTVGGHVETSFFLSLECEEEFVSIVLCSLLAAKLVGQMFEKPSCSKWIARFESGLQSA